MTQHIIDALKEHVDRTPNKLAIWDWQGTQLTYQQLWHHSIQWAACLQHQHHIDEQNSVAISLGRSADHVVALLALWHLNAIAIPLDDALPLARKEHILRQTQAKLVLHLSHHQQDTSLTPHCIWHLNTIDARPLSPTPHQLSALAYIIYTSGSTGEPKGVEITHKGIVPLLEGQIKAFYLTPQSRVLWVTSPSFDASLSDIGTSLLSGATLFIEQPTHPNQIPDVLNKHQITHIDYPPGLLAQVDIDRIPPSLQVMIVGGEPCPLPVARQWSSRIKLISVYGPTEATICVSTIECTPTWSAPWLGDTIADMSWVVLDENNQPTAHNTPGHLHLFGPGLARGYTKEPNLTASRFVTINHTRMYRTGDRVVATDDGHIRFLGRMDRQIKIRGLRIELAEVEHHLMAHPEIQSAVVLKRDLNGQPCLIAFYEGSHLTYLALQRHLIKYIPLWMIPIHMEHLACLPRNLAQKPDLARLKNHPISSKSIQQNQTTSAHPWMALFCQLWSETLHVDITPSTPLHQHHISSLDIMEVVSRGLNHGWTTAPELWQTHPTVASAMSTWSSQHTLSGQRSATSLREDIKTLNLRAITQGNTSKPTHILLTGITGNLGQRLACRFLTSNTSVTALVRATSIKHAQERIQQTLGELATHPKLHILIGDIDHPTWCQTHERWQQLATTVDTIIHCAARIHLIETYEQLRKTNVESLHPIVTLMNTGKEKALHYLSTLSVFVATDQNTGTVFEEDRLLQTRMIYGGYAQSKWAAEVALSQAHVPGTCVWTYRLGLITGDSKTGALHGHNFLHTFIQGMLQLKIAPPLSDDTLRVDITPIDQATELIYDIIHKGPPQTYHIASQSGVALRRLFRLMSAHGYVSMCESKSQWQEQVHQRALSQPSAIAAYLALCRVLNPNDEAFSQLRTMDLFQATNITFDDTNTRRVISTKRHAISDELLLRYIQAALQHQKQTP